MINILFLIILFILIFMIIIMYCIFQNLVSTIIESKWDIRNWMNNAEARLMGELKEIEEKVDKLNIKAIEEKEVDIKAGDEIVDENNDFYFVTYVYGDKVDGISKKGIVREGMEIRKVKKSGRHGIVRIDAAADEKPEWI